MSDSTMRGPLRVMSVHTGPATAESLVDGEQQGFGAVGELIELPESMAQVKAIKDPKGTELEGLLHGWRPNVLYVHGGVSGGRGGLGERTIGAPDQLTNADGQAALVTALQGLDVQLVYLDAAGCVELAKKLHAAGVPNVVSWPATPAPLALPAMHFSHALFAALRNPTVLVPEAFAIATHLTQAYASQAVGDTVSEPPLPCLLSASPPVLPGPASVPAAEGVACMVPGKPLHASVPGYAEIRLLAPHAEVRLLLSSLFTLFNAHCLGHLCQGLRALLAVEMRQLTVTASAPCNPPPGHIPAGSAAVRAKVRTSSGATATVVLAGPPAVLEDAAAVLHGLRQTLTADAQAIQLKLPPAGAPLPAICSTAAVAAGAPLVESLAVCSVWATQVLKSLAQDEAYRGLVAAGVGAVSGSPTAAFTRADANRFTAVVTNGDPARLTQAPPPAVTPAMLAGAAGAAAPAPTHTPAVGGHTPRPPSAVPHSGSTELGGHAAAAVPRAAPPAAPPGSAAPSRGGSPSPEGSADNSPLPRFKGGPWHSDRPPLASCSEDAFRADLIAFLRDRQGRLFDPNTFPEVCLNSARLDLFTLYREVVRRGGYKVGNGINWKGQVFPCMRNYSAGHKMSGVGNALKRHYQQYLLEYEQAHPQDVQRGTDAYAGGAWTEATARQEADAQLPAAAAAPAAGLQVKPEQQVLPPALLQVQQQYQLLFQQAHEMRMQQHRQQQAQQQSEDPAVPMEGVTEAA